MHVNLEFQDSLAFWNGVQGRMKAGRPLGPGSPPPFLPAAWKPRPPLPPSWAQAVLSALRTEAGGEAGVGHLGKELRDPRLRLGSGGCPSGWAPCGPGGSSPCGEGHWRKARAGAPLAGLREEKAANTGPSAEGALEERWLLLLSEHKMNQIY